MADITYTRAESVSTSEGYATAATYVKNEAESASTSEGYATAATYVKNGNETLSTTDVAETVSSYSRSLDDVHAVTDGTDSATTYSRGRIDEVALTEGKDASTTYSKQSSETSSVTDTSEVVGTSSKKEDETPTVVDAADASLTVLRDVLEIRGVSDTNNVASTYIRSKADYVDVTDEITIYPPSLSFPRRIILRNISQVSLVLDINDIEKYSYFNPGSIPTARSIRPLEVLEIPIEAFVSLTDYTKAKWASMIRLGLLEILDAGAGNSTLRYLTASDLFEIKLEEDDDQYIFERDPLTDICDPTGCVIGPIPNGRWLLHSEVKCYWKRGGNSIAVGDVLVDEATPSTSNPIQKGDYIPIDVTGRANNYIAFKSAATGGTGLVFVLSKQPD